MRLATSLVGVLLAGCALYSAPGPDVPAADLILSSNLADDPFGTGENGERAYNKNDFYAFADAGCETLLGGLGLFQAHDGGRKTVRVEAGKRIYIRTGWANQVPIDATREARRSCFNLVSFVPEAGETYELTQDILKERDAFGFRAQCRAMVRTFAGRGPTKSFQDHEFRGQCAEQIKGG